MQYSNYLTQIAALIRQNPSITVREIATELKFADSKSVYYWLEKNNIQGINEFKRIVLSEEKPYQDGYSLQVNDKTRYVTRIPLLHWHFCKEKVKEEWCFLYRDPHPRDLFAVKVGTDQYNPWFRRDDILIIKDSKAPRENDWVLLRNKAQLFIGKLVNKQIIDPMSFKNYSKAYQAMGIILMQERHLSS